MSETSTGTNVEMVTEDGKFVEILKRSNKQIKEDRAVAIAEDVQMIYKRRVEDLEISIKRMYRDLEAQLDLSPANALSLTPAKDFDAVQFVEYELDLGVKIRNFEIKLEIAKKRYNYLFGGM
jgi:hypothetical protein